MLDEIISNPSQLGCFTSFMKTRHRDNTLEFYIKLNELIEMHTNLYNTYVDIAGSRSVNINHQLNSSFASCLGYYNNMRIAIKEQIHLEDLTAYSKINVTIEELFRSSPELKSYIEILNDNGYKCVGDTYFLDEQQLRNIGIKPLGHVKRIMRSLHSCYKIRKQ